MALRNLGLSLKDTASSAVSGFQEGAHEKSSSLSVSKR